MQIVMARALTPFAIGLALLATFFTFVVLTGRTPIEPTHEVVISFLMINGVMILVLVAIIARAVWQVVQACRRGRAAERFHVQIAGLFSILVVLPAALMAMVAYATLHRDLDRLYFGPTREVVQNSRIVANAYLLQQGQLIRSDVLGMANDIAHARALFDQDRESFHDLLATNAASRNLRGAMLIDKDRNIIETAQTSIQPLFTTPAAEFLSSVHESEPEIAVFSDANYIAALIRLRAFNDTFLYVARLLDPRVLAQVKQTDASIAEFARAEARRFSIQVAFAVIGLTILMVSVLIGLNFADRLTAQIQRLMSGASEVSSGDALS
jgi:two-component system nitrogen regulation sensor histidine kinase NtrY